MSNFNLTILRNFFYLSRQTKFIMRTFLVNFIYTSASHSYNADFVLIKQETFPTSHEIYKHIKSTAVSKGLQIQGPILWTGLTELNETDEGQFNFEEE